MSINRIDESRKSYLRNSENYVKTKPLLDNLFTNIFFVQEKIGFFETPYELFKKNCAEVYEKWKETAQVSSILGDLKRDVQYPTNKHKAISKMLAFVGLVESLGVTLADILLTLLIANGKAVHTRGQYIKHISSFSELKQIDWTYKLNFLKDENLTIISKILNLELRNIGAHLKFTVDDDGTIRGKSNNIIQIDREIAEFWDSIDTLTLLFEDLGFLKWLEEMSVGKNAAFRNSSSNTLA